MVFEIIAVLAVLLSVLVPGILFSFAAFYGTKLGRFEKTVFGIIFGVFLPAILAELEFLAFGALFTFQLALFNSLFVAAFALGLWRYQAKSVSPPGLLAWKEEYLSESFWISFAKKSKVMLLLGAIIVFGFYARYATSNDTYFSEIDPYYYTHVTEFIVTKGAAPAFSQEAYFPQVKAHREPPLIHYMAASWFLIYQGFAGVSYSKELLIAVNHFYPPLLGALLSFLGFMLIKEEADRRIALVAAALYAFTPQLIVKLAAGVTEQQPFGIFSALLVFTFYLLAIKGKSVRLGALAGLSTFLAMIGTFQNIWPLMVITGYIAITSILEFWSGELEKKSVTVNLLTVSGAVLGNVVQNLYSGSPPFNLYNGVLLLLAALLPGLLLFYLSKHKLVEKVGESAGQSARNSKLIVLGSLLVLGALAYAFTPVGPNVSSYVGFTLSFSKPKDALLMTVAEEAPSSDAFDLSSYGFFSRSFSPKNLLFFSAIISYALMVTTLLGRKRKDLVLISLAIVFGVFVLNSVFDSLMSSVAGVFGLGQAAEFVAQNDEFYYMGLAIVSAVVTYLFSDRKNKLPILFILIFFPISFIGLYKLKYIVHLATALPVAVAFVLFTLWELVDSTASVLKSAPESAWHKYGRGAVLALGFLFAFFQLAHAAGSPVRLACDDGAAGKGLNDFTSQFSIPGYQASSTVYGLCFSRLDSDWLDVMGWMRANLGDKDRVISWWDYGHWTTFLAGKKTVLDPGNAYPEYDQQVANAFVDGSREDLIRVMKYHGANYAMLDSELIQKWGALNFLSGTYSGLYREPDPADNVNVTPAIDWRKGPGSSTYEADHAFEFIYTVYNIDPATNQPARTNCPGLVPRQALYSSLTGAIYCISRGADGKPNLFVLSGASGEQAPLDDPQLVQMGSDSAVALSPISQQNNFYINTYPGASPYMLNINPDLATLSNGARSSKLYTSNFVQLFFLEKLEGFELVHKTPNGRVKLFKLVG